MKDKPIINPLPNPNRKRLDVLIVSADESEFDITQCTDTSLSLAFEPIGVGLVSAAMGMTHALHHYAPHNVVLVGTCGAYPSRSLHIGNLTVAERFQLTDYALLERYAELAAPVHPHVGSDPHLVASLIASQEKLTAVDATTTMGITTSNLLAKQLSTRSQCDVENMEGYAAAWVCQQHHIPFAALLAVSNNVGAQGRDEWKTHREQCKTLASTAIKRWLNVIQKQKTTH